MSIVMDIGNCNDQLISQQEMYSRHLAENALQIQSYEEYLEKITNLPTVSNSEVRRIKIMIEDLYKQREELSEKYLKACRDKK